MKCRILIIDGDACSGASYKSILEEQGWQTCWVQDGMEGVELARELQPELVFLDLAFHGKSGVEILEELNGVQPDRGIYVIADFQLSRIEDLHAARRKGLKFQLAAKPLAPEQLVAIARVCLSGPSTGRA